MIDIENWITGYERAWASDDPADIAALFTEDAEYFTAPHRDAITPRDAIVEWWRAETEPAEPTFAWGLVALTDETAVVQGRTVYPGAETYLNLWIIRFAPDGRACSFTEWFMEEPADSVS